MENMDDVRKSEGTIADFTKWNGIAAEGKFKHMKISSKEKIFDETGKEILETNEAFDKEETKQETHNKTEIDNSINENEVDLSMVKKKNVSDIPALAQGFVNPVELKGLAIKLLPSVDKIKKEDYDELCEKAIDLAFRFLNVWTQKVKIEEVK